MNNTISIKSITVSPIRLGIIGPAGSGKTWAALTFPNPVIMDMDNKLKGWKEAHPDVDVPVIPIWNRQFVEEVLKVPNGRNASFDKNLAHNGRDAIKRWLVQEGPKLEPGQTLIMDSMTSANDFFDTQTQHVHEVSYSPKTGTEDAFDFWKRKLKFNTEINQLVKNLPCNVVSIFHELPERDSDTGAILGIKPLIQGQSADRVPGYYTDFFRQIVFNKADAKIPPGIEFNGNLTEAYYWHTCKTKLFQLACKSLVKLPEFIPATYSSFLKYA